MLNHQNDAASCLFCSFHFLPARLPAGETPASGVALKAELHLWLIDDSHHFQSIHRAVTACNKSHLVARWADTQNSLESMISGKRSTLAGYQSLTWPRSIGQSLYRPIRQREVWYATGVDPSWSPNSEMCTNVCCHELSHWHHLILFKNQNQNKLYFHCTDTQRAHKERNFYQKPTSYFTCI